MQALAPRTRPRRPRIVQYIGVRANALREIIVESGRGVGRREHTRRSECHSNMRIVAAAIYAVAERAVDRVRDLVTDRHRRECAQIYRALLNDE